MYIFLLNYAGCLHAFCLYLSLLSFFPRTIIFLGALRLCMCGIPNHPWEQTGRYRQFFFSGFSSCVAIYCPFLYSECC
ncbi:hypothetical protein BJ741DRAFT_595121 [Chytriomyces cf. hyalinus JEL632]|nr:hypothetical protein BJ741DRAFT_595121 [Chytriomyces cf. hyalinus JEL632]